MADTTSSQALAALVTAGVRAAVLRMTGPLLKRVNELEQQLRQYQEAPSADQLAQQLDAAVKALPVPKDGQDGKSIDMAQVQLLIDAAVDAKFASLAAPKDGKAADPEVLARMVAEAVAKLPPPAAGKDADPVDIKALAAEVVALMPAAEPGKDADPAMIKQMVEECVQALPVPKDGKDAPAVDLEALAAQVLAKIPVPQDGKSVEPAAVAKMVEEAIKAMPAPKDGKDGKEVDFEAVAGLVARAVAEIPRPKDGEDGRDAVQIEVLDGIDPLRRYQRGTFALVGGGLVRSRRATDLLPEGGELEKAGWQVILRGLAGVDVDVDDDLRSICIKMAMTDGQVVQKSVSLPVTIHRDIWRPEGYEVNNVFHAYAKGDQVTRDGSQWTLMSERANGAPGTDNSGWKLSAKRGRDGRDGLRGLKGDTVYRLDEKQPGAQR